MWEQLDGNKMRWSYRVTCDNAVSMNLGFGRYNMPESGSMIIMDLAIDCQIRPFTLEDNKDHGELWTPIIPSNEAVIEIIVDRSEKKLVDHEHSNLLQSMPAIKDLKVVGTGVRLNLATSMLFVLKATTGGMKFLLLVFIH